MTDNDLVSSLSLDWQPIETARGFVYRWRNWEARRVDQTWRLFRGGRFEFSALEPRALETYLLGELMRSAGSAGNQ